MRKYVALFAIFFLLAPNAYAYQVILSGATGNITASTQFWILNATTAAQTTENTSFGGTPFNGQIGNFFVRLTIAPGVGSSRIFTIHDNAASTSVACTITDSATSCNDSTHFFNYSAGDRLTVESDITNAPSTASFTMGAVSYPANPGDEMLVYRATNPNTGSASYSIIGGDSFVYTTNQASSTEVIADSGTADFYYTNFASSPAVTRSYAMALMDNGVTTAITCTVSNPSTTCNDIAHSASITSGDTLNISSTPTNAPAAINNGGAVRFRSSKGNTSTFMGSTYSVMDSATLTRFLLPSGDKNIATAESGMQQIIPAPTILTNFVASTTPPGGVATRAFTVRKNGADTALTCTLTGSQASCSSSGFVFFNTGDLLSITDIPTGTPIIGNPTTSIAATDVEAVFKVNQKFVVKNSVLIR